MDLNVDAVNENLIAGEWTNIDSENKITEITFLTKDEFIARITFDFKNDEVKVEGNLSKITGSNDNDEFIQRYKDSSEEILKII